MAFATNLLCGAAFAVAFATTVLGQYPDECNRTLLMIKPDGVQRGLIGELIQKFEKKGYKLVAMKMVHADEELAKKHYADHENKTMFPSLINYVVSGPVVPMVWEGYDVIFTTRTMLGGHPQRATLPGRLGANAKYALPGTIRGDYSLRVQRNVFHASDSCQAAAYEIPLWFKPEEVLSWIWCQEAWL